MCKQCEKGRGDHGSEGKRGIEETEGGGAGILKGGCNLVLGGKEGEEEGKEGNAQPGESLVVGTEAVAAHHVVIIMVCQLGQRGGKKSGE